MQRLPLELHEEVFAFVLRVLVERGLYDGRTLAVDATMLEANAAMKSIVRRDSGEGWKQYIKRLAQEAGIENPSEEDARRLDRKRTGAGRRGLVEEFHLTPGRPAVHPSFGGGVSTKNAARGSALAKSSNCGRAHRGPLEQPLARRGACVNPRNARAVGAML